MKRLDLSVSVCLLNQGVFYSGAPAAKSKNTFIEVPFCPMSCPNGLNIGYPDVKDHFALSHSKVNVSILRYIKFSPHRDIIFCSAFAYSVSPIETSC